MADVAFPAFHGAITVINELSQPLALPERFKTFFQIVTNVFELSHVDALSVVSLHRSVLVHDGRESTCSPWRPIGLLNL